MHPIIILWAHPRSMSTAIERIMRERGDLDCLHEPFLHYYYLERTRKGLPHFDSEKHHPTSYPATRDMILQRAESTPVFVKDMSYYVMPQILDDEEFCRRIRHCFLIRNPLRSIVSYYRLDPTVSMSEIGIEAQWLHLQGLHALGIDDCLVLEAEAVQDDSVAVMSLFWQALGLEVREHALSWEQDQIPADWQYVQGWHQSVGASSGIRRSSLAEEEKSRAEFEDLCKIAPQLSGFLQHHLPYYENLRARSLTRGSDAAAG